MKRLILVVFIISCISILAKDMSLEDIINAFDTQSSYKKQAEIELKKLQIGKDINFYEHWFKLNLDTNLKYDYLEKPYGDYEGDEWPHQFRNYPGEGTISVNYQPFYVGFGYNYTADHIKRSSYKVGFSQSLNDFFYSAQVYRDDTLDIQNKKANYSLAADRLEKVEKIIDLYIDVKSAEDAVKNEVELEKQKAANLKLNERKYKVGQVIKLNVDYAKVDLEQERNKIAKLTEQAKQKKIQLLDQVGLFGQYDLNLKDIPEIDITKINLNKDGIRAKDEEINLKEHDIKFLNRENFPEFIAGGSYDLEKKIWEVSLGIKAEILAIGFSNNNENVSRGKLENAKQDLKKLKIEKEDLVKNNTTKTNAMEAQLLLLEKGYTTAKENKTNAIKKKEITDKMYEKDYVNTIDYLKELKEYQEAILGEVQAKNALNGFKYKMMYLKDTK